MKKALLFSVALVAIIAGADAQNFKKGDWTLGANNHFWIGGSVGISNSEPQETSGQEVKDWTYSFSPEFGYAFSDRWAAGVRLPVEFSKRDLNDDDGSYAKNNASGFGISPFVRYTALRWKAVSLFVDGGLRYSNSISKQESDQSTPYNLFIEKNKSHTFGIFIEPGVSVRLTRNFSLIGRLDLFNLYYRDSYNERMSGSRSDITKNGAHTFTAKINPAFSTQGITLRFIFNF
ncbi:MAG: outer membrane beta-barrel protein [Alistipes sp.]|jgi:hypothetical protein|nr:outer membrane beta-barrel protein [Alistipes sp.]